MAGNVVEAAAGELAAALRASIDEAEPDTPLATLRVYESAFDTFDPPAVVIGPPELTWEGACAPPTGAVFPLLLIVPMGDRAPEQLLELVTVVAEVIDATEFAVVLRAIPDIVRIGTREVPAYLIETEAAL